MYGEVELQRHAFLTAIPYGGRMSASRLGSFTTAGEGIPIHIDHKNLSMSTLETKKKNKDTKDEKKGKKGGKNGRLQRLRKNIKGEDE
jgi:hypothetical protein